MTRHPCARCGKRQPADMMIYSRFSRSRYCADINSCTRRAIRVGKARVS